MIMKEAAMLNYINRKFLPETAEIIIDELPWSDIGYYDVYYIIDDHGVDIDGIDEYLEKHPRDENFTFRTEPINDIKTLISVKEFYESVTPDSLLKTKYDIDKYFGVTNQ